MWKRHFHGRKRQPTGWGKYLPIMFLVKPHSRIQRELFKPTQQQKPTWFKMGQGLEQTFLKDDTHVSKEHVGRWSTSPAIREIKSKPQWVTTSRPLAWLLPKCLQITRVGEIGTLVHCRWNANCGSHYSQESSSKIKNKSGINFPYDPASPLLETRLKEPEVGS